MELLEKSHEVLVVIANLRRVDYHDLIKCPANELVTTKQSETVRGMKRMLVSIANS